MANSSCLFVYLATKEINIIVLQVANFLMGYIFNEMCNIWVGKSVTPRSILAYLHYKRHLSKLVENILFLFDS